MLSRSRHRMCSIAQRELGERAPCGPLEYKRRAAVTPGSIFRRFERPSAERRFCGLVILSML